ncbi:hypothetical protein ACFVVM_16775 [Nocardia sp. NPDC058176]|uniref:hypothetical protein n=1 Tax=Nocardia sp. NPDC058176 TaxID=3346368 RepID=UPI0036DBB86E
MTTEHANPAQQDRHHGSDGHDEQPQAFRMRIMHDTKGHDETGAIKPGAMLSGNAYVSVQLRDTDEAPGRVWLVMRPDKCNHGITICPDCAESWELDYLVNYEYTAGGRRLRTVIEALRAGIPADDLATLPPWPEAALWTALVEAEAATCDELAAVVGARPHTVRSILARWDADGRVTGRLDEDRYTRWRVADTASDPADTAPDLASTDEG